MGDIVRTVRRGKFIGWYVRYKDSDGKRKMRASHQPTKELARRFLVAIEARIARGQIGMAEPALPAPTVAELVERFLTEYSRPKIKDLASYRRHARANLRRALPLLGACRADTVQTADIVRLRDGITPKYAPGSVRLCLAFLGTAFAWGIKQALIQHNPVRGVERPVAQPSLDYYSRAEVTALLRAATERATAGRLRDKLLACGVQLAVHTGLRKGELLGLRWPDLDLDTQRLTVARSYQTTPKSGKTRHLRLPASCVPALRAWRPVCPPTPDERVFPVPHAGPHPERAMLGLPKLLAAAGCRVPAHPWHALRHTFASHYVMSGGSILALRQILGHSDVKMTMIYAHLAPDFLGAEMDRLKF